MPKLERLERLELCENQLSGASVGEAIARLYPNLVTIKLSSNKIDKVEDIAGLKSLAKLESLDLSDNPVCTTLGDDYQAKVRAVLSEKLEVLDCLNKAGEEVVSDEDESDLDEEDGQSDDEDDEQGEEELDEGEEGQEEAKEDATDKAAPAEGAKPADEEQTAEASADNVAAKKAKTTDSAPDVPATAEA